MPTYVITDDNLLMIFFKVFLSKALRSPDPKICFSFALKRLWDFHFVCPFWYGWVETRLNGQNGLAKYKFYGYF